MKPRLPIYFLLAALLGWISPALAAPVVTNLTAAQRTGTQLVDIAYDVAAPGMDNAIEWNTGTDRRRSAHRPYRTLATAGRPHAD